MSTINGSRFPTISAANGSRPARLNESSETPFSLQTVRSFASRLRRPLTSILAQFSPSPSIASDRLGYPPLPTPRRTEVPLPPVNLALVDSEELIREILVRIGEDPDREGLQQTPARIVRSWKEIYGGYEQRAEEILVTQFCAGQYDEMVLLRDIEFYSTCEHHMLPFMGRRTSLISRTIKLSGYRNWHGYSRCMRGGSKYRSVSPKRWRRICKGFCNPKE